MPAGIDGIESHMMPPDLDTSMGFRVQAVKSKEAASISSTEVSLCCLSEVIMLGIAILGDDPSTFGKLATLSAGAVCGAAVLFVSWVLFSNAHAVMANALKPGSDAPPSPAPA